MACACVDPPIIPVGFSCMCAFPVNALIHIPVPLTGILFRPPYEFCVSVTWSVVYLIIGDLTHLFGLPDQRIVVSDVHQTLRSMDVPTGGRYTLFR